MVADKKTNARIRLYEEAAKIEQKRGLPGIALMADLYAIRRTRNEGDSGATQSSRSR